MILSCVSQILEKHPFVIMTAFPDKHSTISPSKYGFLDGRGTIDLQNFSDTLHYPFKNKMYIYALFIDVAKVFHTVNHDLLLHKLYRVGFQGPFF